jgi:hypothetical protein
MVENRLSDSMDVEVDRVLDVAARELKSPETLEADEDEAVVEGDTLA